MTEGNPDWQAPPPPENLEPVAEQPQMSLVQTLINIFFEPGAVFDDLRKKPFPRLIFPLIICAVLAGAYNLALQERLGPVRIVQEQLKMPIMERVPEEAKKKMEEDAKNTTVLKVALTAVASIVGFIVVFSIIGLIYWAGGLAFGGNGNFWHGMATVAYSSFPIIVVSMIASLIILFLKSPDDISFMDAQNGLLKINPNLILDASSALKAFFSRIDLLVIWGVFLSAVGLQNVMKVSKMGSWLFSIIIWLIGTTLAVVLSLLFR